MKNTLPLAPGLDNSVSGRLVRDIYNNTKSHKQVILCNSDDNFTAIISHSRLLRLIDSLGRQSKFSLHSMDENG